jgi:hypothetical protein
MQFSAATSVNSTHFVPHVVSTYGAVSYKDFDISEEKIGLRIVRDFGPT